MSQKSEIPQELDVLAHIERAIRAVGEATVASVVSVGRDGRGSGFVIAADRVLTSAHNLRDQTVSVTFADSRTEQGALHAVDVDGDLAVINVPTGDARPLAFASDPTGLGSAVIALSRGGHRVRSTLGFVSSIDQSFRGPRGRVVRGSIEHTAPLTRGSSGGPVLSVSGEVVGINTHRVGDGFYLARASDDVLRSRVGELLQGRSPTRRTLGIAIAPQQVTAQLRQAVGLPERAGLLVRGLDESGPAAGAGVLVGDLIVSAAGQITATADDLQLILESLVTDSIEVGLVRGADELTVTVSFEVSA